MSDIETVKYSRMYGRRWKSYSPTRMTLRFFLISFYFHCLYAESNVGESNTTETAGIVKAFYHPTTSQPFATAPKAPSLLPNRPISSHLSPPDDQATKSSQAKRSVKKSVGYVAEWEYEGSISPALDALDESLGTEQVSPLGKRGNVANRVNEDDTSYPSKRVGPGTWQDSHGSWWLFGGQGPAATSSSSSQSSASKSVSYLSDLWVYDHGKSGWRLVFRPESESSPIHSSYPENLAFPHVCGSEANGHIAVFGGGGISGTTTNLKTSSQIHNNGPVGFSDDNVVWLFDIPINKSVSSSSSAVSQQLDMGWDGSEGLWTSYICCDACLPDGNATLEFCPRFSREPILWCGQDALMALQISHVDSSKYEHVSASSNNNLGPNAKEGSKKRDSLDSSPLNEDINGSTLNKIEGKSRESNTQAGATKSRSNLPEEIISPNGHSTSTVGSSFTDGSGVGAGQSGKNSESQSAGNQINTTTNTDETSRGTEEVGPATGKSKMSTKRPSLRATWWKFDLAATEWEKMPEVNVSRRALDLIETGECRTVSDQTMVYIICPAKENILERSVLVFDPRQSTIDLVDGRMELNNAFRDRKVWQLGRSTLQAIRNDDQMTVLFLAYHKLLDLWIHDHSSNRLIPVENVWKGSSLHAFQRSASFYKISISFASNGCKNAPVNSNTTNNRIDNGRGPYAATTTCENKNYSFYMANPRNKLFEFHDYDKHVEEEVEKSGTWMSSGKFHISIVTDQSVFLPARDATFLINPKDEENESGSSAGSTSTSSTSTTTRPRTSQKSSSNKPNDLLRTSAIPSTSISTNPVAENPKGKKFKPAKIISGKVPLSSRLYNGALQITSGRSISSSKSNASITTTSSQVEMTTATTPTILSSQVEQKLTLQSKFNLDRHESTNFPQEQQQLLPRSRITVESEGNRTSMANGANATADTKGQHLVKLIQITSANVNLQNKNESAKNESEQGKGGVLRTASAIDPQQQLQQQSSLTLNPVPVNNSSLPRDDSSNRENHQSTQASSISSSSPTPLTQPPVVITMAPSPTKKPITMPKRIPKGVLRAVGVKMAESRSGKIVNLLPVKKTSLAGADKKEKPIEVDRAHEQENGNVQTREEITVADHGNESLRSNRIQSWNDSRNDAAARASLAIAPSSRVASSSDLGDESTANLKTSSAETIVMKSKPTTTPVISYDDAIHVTLSYTVVNDAINTNSITAVAKESLDESSLEDEEESERRSNSMTYQASSEVIFENHDAVRPISDSSIVPGMSASYSSMLFFAVSLSIFATFGIVLFVRRCVKCPPRRQSVLIKEPPPIRYSVIPDELSYHTPIV